jgi:hypothetical protein
MACLIRVDLSTFISVKAIMNYNMDEVFKFNGTGDSILRYTLLSSHRCYLSSPTSSSGVLAFIYTRNCFSLKVAINNNKKDIGKVHQTSLIFMRSAESYGR